MDITRDKPLIAITLGDPAGVGPEVIAGAWDTPSIHEWCRPFVIGPPPLLSRAARWMKRDLRIVPINNPTEARPDKGLIPCLPISCDKPESIVPGELSAQAGQIAYEAVMKAIDLALAKQIDAIVTAPLSKTALWQAGHHYPGHTELLAERCGVKDFAMMLYLGPAPPLQGQAGLGVAHVTLHMALKDVFQALTVQEIVTKAKLADQVMRGMKGSQPKIGVCALNPHAGEEGLFGDEERRLIQPAIAEARSLGLDISGPYPADSLFVRAREGEFDAVVAMYHDQGHIALKLLGMHRAVNITLGLPIVRTSVAHGTAFELAGKGTAESSSMVEAIRVATRLVKS